MSGRSSRKSLRDSRIDDEDSYEDGESDGEKGGRRRSKLSRKPTKDDEYYAKIDQELQKSLEEFDETDAGSSENNTKRFQHHDDWNVGAIIKIYVENFMCHRKFDLTLHKGLNFINGSNGSGKSAIAAALQLCLGASTRNTRRGTNLATLIREGSPGPAILRVTLNNKGPDAFKPELYGNRITVERKIPRTGGASYHLKNSQGHEVSNQKAELINMMRCFDVHVDNPCCVLTQEDSKKFVNGKNEEKYEFFLKATGLDVVREEILEIAKNLDSTEEQLEKQSKLLEPKQAHVKKLQNQLEQLEELEHLETDIQRFAVKALWADHRASQAELSSVENDKAGKARKLEQAEHNLEVANSRIQPGEEVETLQAELETFEEQLRGTKDDVTSKVQRSNEAARAVLGRKSDIEQVQRQIAEYQNRHKGVATQIRQSREKALQSARRGEGDLLTQIGTLESGIEASRAKEEMLRQQKQRGQAEEHQLQTELNRSQSALQHLVGSVNRARNDIQQLNSSNAQNSPSQRAGLLHKGFPAFLQILQQNASRFRDRVVGPLGLHVQLREGCEHWGAAVERAIGWQLASFIVTNTHDRQTLDALMRQSNINNVPIIIQTEGPRYRVQNCSDYTQGTPTVLDTLVIADDLVFNCLVDQAHIEKVLLVQNENQVESHFVERDERGHDRLQFGAASVLTQNATLIKYAYGNQSSETSNRPPRNFLAKDMSSVLQSMQQNLQRLQQEQQESNALMQEQQQALQQLRSQLTSFDAQLRDTQQALRTANREKSRLEEAVHEAQQAAQGHDTSLLEQELSDLENAIESMKTQLDQANAELSTLQREQRALDTEKNEAIARRKQIEQSLTDREDRIEDIMKGREEAMTIVSKLQRDVDGKKRELEIAEQDVKKAREVVEANLAVASEQTAAFDSDWDGNPWKLTRDESRANLERNKKKAEIELREGKRRVGHQGLTIAIAQERFQAANKELQQLQDAINSLAMMKSTLESDNDKRKKKWMNRLKKSSRDVQTMFVRYVEEKGAGGAIEFNHKQEKTLTIKYQVEKGDPTTMRDICQLSGGEHSFVTFSFQLALGHVIESPFRLMDEYDVYIDSVARRLTLDQLQAYSRSEDQRFRQFIIITPQTLADVKTSQFVHIFKMPDPVRQSAVGPQQQTID